MKGYEQGPMPKEGRLAEAEVWAGQCRGDRDEAAASCLRAVLKALLVTMKISENS